ncbi:MAG: ATP synthase subunit I [Nitrospirae bacterium]|nr:ATP synthase subunit I [Nitrospirota bacterium]
MKEMISVINRQSAFIVLPLAVVSFFVFEWRFALSVIIGGLIGALNFKGLCWSVNSLLGIEKAETKMMFLSFIRLFIIFSVLVTLAALGILKAAGLLVGFTVVFIIIVKEGLLKSIRDAKKQDSGGLDG